MAKSVQETSPDGPCVAKARAFHSHSHTRSVSVTGLEGGGVNALGKFPKKKKGGFRIFSFLSRNFMPRKLSSFDCAFSTLYTLYTILKITGTESSDLNFTRSEQEHATLRYA